MMSLSEEYKEYCENFKIVWSYLSRYSKSLDSIVKDVCEYRQYYGSEERWRKLFSETGILFVSSETCDYSKLKAHKFKDMALFSDKGYFLLDERYILPVRDMLGNIVALVGWYPDSKKYITTPSKFFVKDCLFFGMEQLRKTGTGKNYFLVEGIFDSLNLRTLGFNAVAQMGINSSKVKSVLYGLFRKIVAVPDNDTQGRKVLKGDLWGLPVNASYLKWTGGFELDGEIVPIKDIDRLCSLYDDDSVSAMLKGCLSSNDRVIKIEI